MKKEQIKETLSMVLDNLPLPAILHRADTGRILQYNPAARKLFKFPPKSRTITFDALWHEKAIPSKKKQRLGPYVLRNKAGRETHFHIHRQTLVVDGADCFLDYLEMVAPATTKQKDTKQNKAQARIIADGNLSNTIINSLPGIFYLFDQNGKFLRWNKNFETVSGYSGEEIAVMHPLDFFEASDKPIVKEKIQSVFITGMAEVEVDFLTKNGAKIPHYFNGWARDFEGQICLIGMGVDISARREAEYQSGHKARMIQDLLNGITDGFLATDRDLNFTLVNPAFCEFVKRSEAEVIGKNLLDLLPFIKNTELDKQYRIAIETDEPFSIESRNSISPYQTFQINGYPNPGGIFIYYKDISIRKLAERKLQESQNRLKAFFESTSDCILLLDPDFTVLDFNRVAEKLALDLTGITLQYGLNLRDVAASSFQEIFLQLTNTFAGQDTEFESELVYKNGQKEWWRIKLIPMRAPEGTIIAAALNGTNIDTLKRTSQRVITMADNIPDGFIYEYSVNATGTETVFTYSSQGIEALCEISADELLSDARLGFNLVHEEDLPRVREAGRISRETLKNLEVDFRIRLASGREKWVKAKATPHRRPNGSTDFMALIMDITRQKKLEEEQATGRVNLEKSENELRAIIDALGHATVLLDRQGCIQNFNAYASTSVDRILSRRLEKGDSFVSLIPAFFQPDFQTNFGRALSGEKVVVEREIQNVNAQKFWLELLYLPVLDKNGTVTGVTFNVTDLTQKKETEAQYKKSIEQMRFAARLAKFGEWEFDLTTRTPRWSDEVCRIHGVVPGYTTSLEEAIDFYTEESRPFVANAVQKCIDTGDWYDLTVQIISKSGRKKWVRTIGVSERVNDKAVKLYGLLQDIDDVKQKQEETARLALIAKETSNLVVITGADRKIQWVNESFLQTTGYSQREVVGRSPGELLQGVETDPATVAFVREKLHRNETVKFEIINYKKSGEKYWLDIEIQPVFNASGELDYFIGMQSNITERKLAEDSLKESEQRFRTIADAAPVMMWMSGLDNLCFYINKGWLDFTGRTTEQELGKGWIEGVHPDDVDGLREVYAKHFDAQTAFMMEYRLRHHDGQYRWIVDNGIPRFLPNGQFIGYIGSCFDIHDRKEAEENLKLTQDVLTQGLKEKESLIKEIHHRVKNNLQLISSILYLKMSGMHQSDMKDFLEDTRQKIRSIALIHERLLQSGSMHQVDIADYLNKLILDLQMTLAAQNLHLEIDAHIAQAKLNLDLAINCGLILNELITNAIKHAFPGQRDGTVSVTFDKTDDGFQFTVADNGVGLPAAVHPGEGGFGMQLLDVFLRQLKATVNVEREDGTKYDIRFVGK